MGGTYTPYFLLQSIILIGLLFDCLLQKNNVVQFLLQAVTLHTDVGDIKIELFCERTPKACEVSHENKRYH